jgi:hypothetical protein
MGNRTAVIQTNQGTILFEHTRETGRRLCRGFDAIQERRLSGLHRRGRTTVASQAAEEASLAGVKTLDTGSLGYLNFIDL